MKIAGIIPARLASTRLPQKLIRVIAGKPLLQWTWEAAKKCRTLDRLIIACDDEKVASIARDFGAEIIMTHISHQSGTDRVAQAARDIDVNVIINIQADEPLIHSSVIDRLSEEMKSLAVPMATVRKKFSNIDEVDNPNIVKVICDKHNNAVYFSRWAIPYYRDQNLPKVYYKHIGIYAYSKDFLYTLKNMPVSNLEKAEKLEQLRVIEAGYKIKVVETQFDSIGVDTEEDLIACEKIIKEKIAVGEMKQD